MPNKFSQIVLLLTVSLGSCLYAAEPRGTVLSIYYLKTKSPGGYNAIVEELVETGTDSRTHIALASIRNNRIIKKSTKMNTQTVRSPAGRLIILKDFWSEKTAAKLEIADSGEIFVEGVVSGEQLHRRQLVRAEDFLDPDTQAADVYKIIGAELSLDQIGLEQADTLVVKMGERLGGGRAGYHMKIVIGQLRDRRILPVDTLAGFGSKKHILIADSPDNLESEKIEIDLTQGRILISGKNQSAKLIRINKPKFLTSVSADTVAAAALDRWAGAVPHAFEKLDPQLTGERVETCEFGVTR